MSDAAENIAAWADALRVARDIDPVIREALRPVFETLKERTPDVAAAMALAMICRALRMLSAADGAPVTQYQTALCQAALAEVAARPDHPN